MGEILIFSFILLVKLKSTSFFFVISSNESVSGAVNMLGSVGHFLVGELCEKRRRLCASGLLKYDTSTAAVNV